MLRTRFDQEMQTMQERLLALGSEVAHNVSVAVDALLRQDELLSGRIITADTEINRKQIGLELDCLSLIARQQPTARDLRFIASVIAVAGELERIHDYAKGIGRINQLIGHEPQLAAAQKLRPMAALVCELLARSLDAFAARDVDQALALYWRDDEVDELYNGMYGELVEQIVADPDVMDQATHLLWAAHNLERTGDRVCNITERVIFVVTGDIVESREEMEISFPQ